MPKYTFDGTQLVLENVFVTFDAKSEEDAWKILYDKIMEGPISTSFIDVWEIDVTEFQLIHTELD